MRTDTTVRDVMHREFLGVSESDALADAAALLVEEGTDCLIVVRGGEPVGRVEARDALASVLAGDDGATVGSTMRDPPPTVAPTDSLSVVEAEFVSEGVGRLVVVDDGEAVGVVTPHDALAAGTARGTDARDPTGDLGVGVVDARSGEAVSEGAAGRPTSPAMGVSGAEGTGMNDGGSTAQGVCERCGALTPSLATANGQAVCPACHRA